MEPRALDPVSGNIVLTIQAFLVRTQHHTILIDTCVGDHKPRPHRPFWHMQKLNTFLPRLAAAGVAPEDVDYVCARTCTGTCRMEHATSRRSLGAKTFPNAKYIFARREWEGWEELHRSDPQPHLVDSILPVMEAGQAQLVSSDFALDDEVWLEPTRATHLVMSAFAWRLEMPMQLSPATPFIVRCSVWNRTGSCVRISIPLSQQRPGGVSWNVTATAGWWCVRRIFPNPQSVGLPNAKRRFGSSIRVFATSAIVRSALPTEMLPPLVRPDRRQRPWRIPRHFAARRPALVHLTVRR